MSEERSYRLFSAEDGQVWAYLDHANGRATRLRMLNQCNKPLSVTLTDPEGAVITEQHLPAHKGTSEMTRRNYQGVRVSYTEAVAAEPVEIALDFPVRVTPGQLHGFLAVVVQG